MPLSFLMTGVIPKHPVVIRVLEAAILGIASGALTLVIGVKLLEKDITIERERLTAHLLRYDAQLLRRDAEIVRQRVEIRGEVREATVEVMRKLERIEDCIRVRSCVR